MAASPPLMEPSSPPAAARPSAKTQAAPARVLPLPCLIPAVVAGAMMCACFHPLAWGLLGWVAVVPLLCLVRSSASPRRIYLSAWAGGIVFFLPALQWLRVADQWMPFPKYPMHGAWLLLTVYCALYFPAAIYLTRVLESRTRLPLVVTFPVVWVALEFARSFLLSGFAWYYLAHTQHENLAIIQVADLGGVYAVSLLVAAVNALLFDMLYQFPEVRGFLRLREPPAHSRTFGDDWPELGNFFLATWRRGVMIDALAVTVLVGAAYVYGTWRLEQDTVRRGPIVALLQGNLDQRLNNAAFEQELPADQKKAAKILRERHLEIVRRIGSHYEALCVLAKRCDPQPDLFVWPETSDPSGWVEVARAMPIDRVPEEWRFGEERSRLRLAEAFEPLKTPQLLGIATQFLGVDRKERRYNSALLVNAQGIPEGRYDKMHRVPFGEFVPFREVLPFMNWLAPYDFDYSIRSGETFTRFALGDYRFGVLICYEDTDPFLARHYVRSEDDGPPVDFLVNMSNDGWFNGSAEHEEHLAVSRFRAIECRRAIVRSVNMGISAVIDGNGRVLKAERANAEDDLPMWSAMNVGGPFASMPHADWASFKKVAGVLIAAVPIDDRFSPYALFGDWLAGLCWLLIGVATIGMALYRRVRPIAA